MGDLSSGYEILVGACEIYYADVGTPFPELDAAPGVDWTSLGESDEDGVTVNHTQSTTKHRIGNRTGAVKASREEEDLTISANLAVMTLENMAVPLEAAVTETEAGSSQIGLKSIPMHRGLVVQEHAFLLRGKSAYGDYPSQYQVPRAFIDGDMEVVHNKSDKAVLPIEISALEDLSASAGEEFGTLVMQTDEATA